MNNSRQPVIIVVNDDHTQLRLLSGILRRNQEFIVHEFTAADEALAAMAMAPPPSLIITDLYMPGIDGWRFCRLLRSPEFAAFNAVPVLVVSATFAGEDANRITAETGADGLLPMPVDAKRLLDIVQAMLHGESHRHHLRVLIVESDNACAHTISQAFAAHGYQPATVGTLADASAQMAAEHYDVVILASKLPDGRCESLLGSITISQPDCVCIVVADEPVPATSLAWIRQGAAASICRPFSPPELLELCARGRRERALLRVERLLEQRTRELRESEEQYRRLFDNAGEAIFVAQDGSIVFLNPMTTVVTGRPAAELLARPFSEFIHPEDQEMVRSRHFQRLRGEPTPNHYCFRIIHRDGRTRWVELNSVLIFWQGSTATLNFLDDITARKQAEHERDSLEAQLRQVHKMEAVGMLAGGVAHDFNNMLGVIQGHVHLARKQGGDAQKITEHLQQIDQAASRCAELTAQLLAFARKQAITPVPLDLNHALAAMLPMLRPLVGEKISLDLAPGADLWHVKLDPNQLEQAMVNLAVNSRDAIADTGAIRIDTSNVAIGDGFCRVHPEFSPGEYVLLTFSDTGCGIDETTRARIFEPFFTTKAVGVGTGLGLSMVYGMIKQNHGVILVDSHPGMGTSFNLYFPRMEKNDETPEYATTTATTSPNSPGTVLLVEDEAQMLQLCRFVLEADGYHVLATADPTQALAIAEHHPGEIDLLLSDVVMPNLNGRDLQQRIVARRPEIKTLFMSGYTADIISHHGVVAKNVNFIQKPISPVKLSERVRQILRGK